MNNNIIIYNKLEKKKVPLYVFIYAETDKTFRKFIALKYQRIEKGLLSYEVEQALSNYMRIQNSLTQQQQHTQNTKAGKLLLELEKTKCNMIEYLKSEFHYEDIRFVPETHLDMALTGVRGITDPRSLKKWKGLLIRCGFAKKSGPQQYEFL